MCREVEKKQSIGRRCDLLSSEDVFLSLQSGLLLLSPGNVWKPESFGDLELDKMSSNHGLIVRIEHFPGLELMSFVICLCGDE
jgi:hypothetical protein